jgi:hypothetical protein
MGACVSIVQDGRQALPEQRAFSAAPSATQPLQRPTQGDADAHSDDDSVRHMKRSSNPEP